MDKQSHELIIDQLNRQGGRLDTYNAHLERLTATVEEHVRRTDLLEQKVKPIEQHVHFINTLSKVVAGAAAFVLVLKNLGVFH